MIKSYFEILESAKETIELEYKYGFRLEDLAAKYNLSKFHFHRLFKSYFKITPKEFCERLRLERAAHLLKYTNASIIDIAFEFGYGNHETFTRSFKRFFRINPRQYRKHEKQSGVLIDSMHSNDLTIEHVKISGPIIKYLDEVNLAYIRHIGDYKKVDKTWRKLVKVGWSHNILDQYTKLYGIYYDDPEITQESNLRFDACFEIEESQKFYKGLSYRKTDKGKYLIFRCTCELKHLPAAYDLIYGDYILNQNIELEDRPVLEIYLTSPAFHIQKKYITEICIPIK